MENEKDPSNVDVDSVKQLKAEFGRKHDNTNSKLDSVMAATQKMMDQLAALTAPPIQQNNSKEEREALRYSDPAKHDQLLIQEAAQAATLAMSQSINAQQQQQQRIQNVIADVGAEYPELADVHSDLTKKAVEIYTAMTPEEKTNPISYKLAAREAAGELGIKPKSKRTEDEVYMSSGFGGGGDAPRRPKGNSTKLDPAVEAWGHALGLDMDDTELKKRLIERSNRNWSSREEPIKVITKKGKK